MNPIPPDWYPDPTLPNTLRWWDGTNWTAHLAPQMIVPVPPDPKLELAREQKWGQRAKLALWGTAAIQAVGSFLAALFYGQIWTDQIEAFRQIPQLAGTGYPQTPTPSLILIAMQPISLASIALFAVFIVWFYSAASFAAHNKVPARRDPIWTIAGFLIPIINFWFPYRSAKDLFPEQHAGNRIVKIWWTLYLTDIFVGIAVIICAPFSVILAVILAVVATAVGIATAIAGRTLITKVEEVHTELTHVS